MTCASTNSIMLASTIFNYAQAALSYLYRYKRQDDAYILYSIYSQEYVMKFGKLLRAYCHTWLPARLHWEPIVRQLFQLVCI